MSTVIEHGDCTKLKLPDGIMITDPPFNIGYGYNSYKDRLSPADYVTLLSVIKPPCVVIHYPEETINILSSILGKCEQVVSWVYNSNTGKQHRTISWWGCKPDFKKVRQPYKNPTDKRVLAMGIGGAKLYDWWEIQMIKNNSKEKVDHPCQMPEEVLRRIILTTVRKDQLIVDPFAGAGTTLKVAKDLGYSSYGVEIDSKYVQVIKNRLIG